MADCREGVQAALGFLLTSIKLKPSHLKKSFRDAVNSNKHTKDDARTTKHPIGSESDTTKNRAGVGMNRRNDSKRNSDRDM